MLRVGARRSQSREMDIDDLFTARLNLMIIMTKAYLDGDPLGEYRRRAMLENARCVESECMDMGNLEPGAGYYRYESPALMEYKRVFYSKAKLLAVMLRAVASGIMMDKHRKAAMRECVDEVCQMMRFGAWRGKDK